MIMKQRRLKQVRRPEGYPVRSVGSKVSMPGGRAILVEATVVSLLPLDGMLLVTEGGRRYRGTYWEMVDSFGYKDVRLWFDRA